MGGARARVAGRARDAGAPTKDQGAQDHATDRGTLTRAGDNATRAIGANASADQLSGLPPSYRQKSIAALAPSARRALFAELGKDPAFLDDLFAATPNAEADLLRDVLIARFHKDLKTADHATWDAGALRRLYAVLAALPVQDVAQNTSLGTFNKYTDSDERYVHGAYHSDGRIDLSYQEPQLQTVVHGEYVEKTDALAGVNEFDAAARHEVGHAIDAEKRYTDTHQGEKMFGGWESHSVNEWVIDILRRAGGTLGSHRDSAQVVRILADCVENDTSTNANGAADTGREGAYVHAAGNALAEAGIHVTPSAEPGLAAIGRVLTGAKPWNRDDGGGALAGRVYEESYKGDYMSYDASTRQASKRCSLYQFRAPGEFFAEAYAAYYEPVKKGELRGKLLADRNKPLFDWFVHRFELPAPKKP